MKNLRQHTYFSIGLFLLLYALFYWGNKGFIGLSTPGNSYLPWLDKYFDYVEVYRNFLLQSSAVLLRIIGHHPTVSEYVVRLENGYGVRLVYSCLGFAVLSFWWAMILAFPQTLRNKLLYLIGGTLIIIGLNVLRITAVAIVFASKWARAHPNFDHHLVFNIFAYGILFYMLYRWFNISPKVENTGIATRGGKSPDDNGAIK